MRARQRKRPKNRNGSRSYRKPKAVTNSIWSDRNQVATEKLDCLNEAYRKHKSRSDDNSWKLTPKDSCEVHRNRLKRSVETEENEDSKPKETKGVKKIPKIVKKGPNNRKRRLKRTRSISSSSIPTCTSFSSMSCSSASDVTSMEYDD